MLLGEFARRIDAETQLVVKKHRHVQQQQQQQQQRGDSALRKAAAPQQKPAVGCSRVPATSWSAGKRWGNALENITENALVNLTRRQRLPRERMGASVARSGRGGQGGGGSGGGGGERGGGEGGVC